MAEMGVEMMGELEVVESWKDAGGSRSSEGDQVINGGGLGEVMEERWWWWW